MILECRKLGFVVSEIYQQDGPSPWLRPMDIQSSRSMLILGSFLERH
jgi:hypothetical protein